MDVREVCAEIEAKTGCESVSIVGNKFVLYKESQTKKKIVLPKD